MPDITIFWFAAIILVLYILLKWHHRRLEIWGKIGLTIGIIMSAIGLLTFVLGPQFELPIPIRVAIVVAGAVILAVIILYHYGFIRRPRRWKKRERTIKIEGLNRTMINSIILTSFGENPQRFVGNVWTIRVHNELLKSLSNCNSEIRVLIDGRDRGDYLPLRWRGHEELPTRSNYGGSINSREQYRDSLGFSYIGSLYSSGTESVTIPEDGRNEVFFLFTFSESNSIFIISLTSRQMLGEQDMTLITIPFVELDRITFLIRFYSDQNTDSYEKMFRLDTGRGMRLI
jgi:hypothetical protein